MPRYSYTAVMTAISRCSLAVCSRDARLPPEVKAVLSTSFYGKILGDRKLFAEIVCDSSLEMK